VLGALAAAITGSGDVNDLARRAGAGGGAVHAAAQALTGGGPTVIVWGERVARGPRGGQAVAALLALARGLGIESDGGSGMIEIPAGANGRGLREAGCLPNLKCGLADADTPGLSAAEIPGAVGEDLNALILFQADPVRTHPDRAAWEG